MPGRLAPALLLHGLGFCSLCAFVSLWTQIDGLVGPRGIAPAEAFMEAVSRRPGGASFLEVPTLCWWIGASGPALHGLCAAGCIASLLLMLGRLPLVGVLVAWACYASLVGVGQVFLRYQWDSLLLEALALAALVAPLRSVSAVVSPLPGWIGWWGLRGLVFKLMLLSGIAKLASGDPTWRDLSALDYHYLTTCLPSWTGFFAARLPGALHAASVLGTFAIELVLPWFVFAGRRGRLLAFCGFVALQIGIGSTGSYGFFNALTVVLCFSLLDDELLGRILPRVRSIAPEHGTPGILTSPGAALRTTLALFFALVWLPTSFAHGLVRLSGPSSLPAPAIALLRGVAPWYLANGYGLFANMTTRRPEIEIEVSRDGSHWEPLRFRWKPGEIDRRPRFVTPLHMPRLDWQMWFAALGSYRSEAWFQAFVQRVLEAEPAVLALLEEAPLGGEPPLFVRSQMYEYRFASFERWRAQGEWWQRDLLGPYSPVLRLPPDRR